VESLGWTERWATAFIHVVGGSHERASLQSSGRLAVGLARLSGALDAEVEAIGYGAVLHDVGKMGVPEAILPTPGPLSDDEWVERHRHPVGGATIVEPLRLGRLVAPIVRAHHERWDRRGPPTTCAGRRSRSVRGSWPSSRASTRRAGGREAPVPDDWRLLGPGRLADPGAAEGLDDRGAATVSALRSYVPEP
jgi:HD domain